MARGQQKIQAQQKNAEKKAKLAKAASGGKKDNLAAATKVLCSVCKSPMVNLGIYKDHFQAKHPKFPLPDELK